jgi:hypothetical protein
MNTISIDKYKLTLNQLNYILNITMKYYVYWWNFPGDMVKEIISDNQILMKDGKISYFVFRKENINYKNLQYKDHVLDWIEQNKKSYVKMDRNRKLNRILNS